MKDKVIVKNIFNFFTSWMDMVLFGFLFGIGLLTSLGVTFLVIEIIKNKAL